MERIAPPQGRGSAVSTTTDVNLPIVIRYHQRLVVIGAVAAGFAVVQFIYKIYREPMLFSTVPRAMGEGVRFSALELLPMALAIGCGVASRIAYAKLIQNHSQKRVSFNT